MLAVELESFLILNLCEYALVDENDTSSHKTGTAITCTTRAVGGQRARLLGTFYIVTFLSLSHII